MAKRLKRRLVEQDVLDYGKGDPLLDLLREYLKDDIDRWKSIVANDKKCQRERRQKEINNQRRYKI